MSKILEEKNEKLSPEKLNLLKLRHTTEHVLHTAMQNLYPNLKKAMGPATDDGFYFDFDLDQKISENDFEQIEKEMKRLINQNLRMVNETINIEEARKIFKNNPYKMDSIDLITKRGENISIYKMVDKSENVLDLDLCSGPHLDWVNKIKAFKLLNIAGAYWHGDEKNKMLTRIYGTSFYKKEELEKYLWQLEEAKKRDHRKLGKDLDLFVFSDLVGKGLPMLTEKGATLKRVLERFIVDEEIKRGYLHVVTPPLAKIDLYKTSGHYPYYKDTMYPTMIVDDEELILRPMTCPHHFMLYKSKPRSYKDLPVRLAEISPQFRYEKSGELSGLIRVRMFMLADAHIVSRRSQASNEIKKVLELIDFVNEKLGLVKGTDYRYRLSLGDREDSKKYYKDDIAWEEAEGILRSVLNEIKAPYYEAKNEAAFYGPKIDVQMKNVNAKEETAFTVQYDFVMPKRFELTYINEKGKQEEPIVIHRASLGCFERTIAFLIEHFKGAFPLWLSPIQVAVLPISNKFESYAEEIYSKLMENNIRAVKNIENETIGKKIRASTLQKIPYMVIIGERESESNHSGKVLNVSIRTREGKDLGLQPLNIFINNLKEQIGKFL